MVSDVGLFADDTALFSVVYDEQVSADILNADLKFIEKWAYQWKMQFNPDKNKQAILGYPSLDTLRKYHEGTQRGRNYSIYVQICVT